NGGLAGAFSIDAVLGTPSTKVQGVFGVTPSNDGPPIEGQIAFNFDQATGKLRLDDSRLATAASSIDASGTLGETLAVRFQSTRLDDVMPALALAGQADLPVKVTYARASFSGNVTGALDDPHVAGDASLTGASIDGHAFDRFTANINASRRSVKLDRVSLARGSTEVNGSAEIAPPDRSGTISGQLQIRNADITALSKEAGVSSPISGTAGGTVKISGTVARPEADATVQIDKPAGFGEQLDQLRAHVVYSPASIRVTDGSAGVGAAKLQFQGSFQHREDDWKNGDGRFEVGGQNVMLSSIKSYVALDTGVDSRIDLHATGVLRLGNGEPVVTAIDGDAKGTVFSWEGGTLCDVSVIAATRNSDLRLEAAAKVRDVNIDAHGTWKLEGDFPGSATLRANRVNVATLHRVVMTGSPLEQNVLPFEGFLDGVNGTIQVALRKPRDFQAELSIPILQINAKASQTLRLGVQAQDVVVKNSEPIAVSISAKE